MRMVEEEGMKVLLCLKDTAWNYQMNRDNERNRTA